MLIFIIEFYRKISCFFVGKVRKIVIKDIPVRRNIGQKPFEFFGILIPERSRDYPRIVGDKEVKAQDFFHNIIRSAKTQYAIV
jgi:hypothetical protein